MSKLCLLISIIFFRFVYADCSFVVTNNSSEDITVEAGFFGKGNTVFTVEGAMSKSAILKSNFKCNNVDRSGLGIAYINLIGGRSKGGWVYDPLAGMIRANGRMSKSADGRIGVAKNGSYLFLLNTINPESDQFVVQIKNISRNISRQFGSMN